MNILYLCPEIPFPPTSGGKAVFKAHLEELAAHGDICVQVVCVDVDDRGVGAGDVLGASNVAWAIYPRETPRLTRSPINVVRSLWRFLSCQLPRAVAARKSEKAQRAVADILAKGGVDAIVADHLTAMALMPKGVRGNLPLILIEHNIEQQIARQRSRLTRWFNPMKVVFMVDQWRTARYEDEACHIADKIVYISSSDLTESPEPEKAIVLPFMLKPQERRWRRKGKRCALFVGSPHYFPNRDAIRWICIELAPELAKRAPECEVGLIGTHASELPKAWMDMAAKSVRCYGFVDRERLLALHEDAGLFLCPLRFGSGIKIKTLEALSLGMPVLSTPEGVRGMDFVSDETLLDVSDAGAAAARIAHYLNSDADAVRLAADNLARYELAYRSREGQFAKILQSIGRRQGANYDRIGDNAT